MEVGWGIKSDKQLNCCFPRVFFYPRIVGMQAVTGQRCMQRRWEVARDGIVNYETV